MKWIKVEESLPEYRADILLFEKEGYEDGYVYTGWRDFTLRGEPPTFWNAQKYRQGHPTHWMPFPKGPKEDV